MTQGFTLRFRAPLAHPSPRGPNRPADERPRRADHRLGPYGTRFCPGEGLRLVIQASDIHDYLEPGVHARHEDTVNQGHHVVHAGPGRDFHLVIPEIIV